jgi:hypothetical protein
MKNTPALLLLLAALSLSACGGNSALPPAQGNAADYLSREMRGYAAPFGIAMGKENAAYWLSSLVSNYQSVSDGDQPSEVRNIAANSGCGFYRPNADEMLAKIFVSGGLPTPLYALSTEDIAKRADTLIKKIEKDRTEPRTVETDETDQFRLIDVVVTETSKPVYVVLNYSGNVIFNFHLAEGAKISRVALIAWQEGGVANVGDDVKINHLIGERMLKCKIIPALTPKPHWNFVSNVASSGIGEDVLKENHVRASKYNNWFNQTFGQSFENGWSGADSADHVLIGPALSSQDQFVTYRPLSGSVVHLTSQNYTLGSIYAYREKNDALVTAEVKKRKGAGFLAE